MTHTSEQGKHVGPIEQLMRDQEAEINRLRLVNAELLEACHAMLEAYAPKADWSKPKELHSAVFKAGEAIAKAQGTWIYQNPSANAEGR